MAANTPNMGAITAIGAQFHNDVFKKAQHHINRKGTLSNIKAKREATARNSARDAWANSVNTTLKTAHASYAQQAQQKQSAATAAAKTHAAGVKSGRVAPVPGSAPRTFAMGSTPQQKAEAKVMQQQRNYAHGQAIGEQKQRDRMAMRVNTPPKNPGQKTVPTKPTAGQFPKAQFPAGASSKPLPTASAAHSLPGKPQTFTQGAYTHKPGGIAAAGSRLEAWAQTKTMAVQARQKSRAAGGRDKGLAQKATQFEAQAAAPLSGQAPTTKEE
jgi:hypothetical protein